MKKKIKFLTAMLVIATLIFSVPIAASAGEAELGQEPEISKDLEIQAEDKVEEPLVNEQKVAAPKIPELKAKTATDEERQAEPRLLNETFSEIFPDQALADAVAEYLGKTKDQTMTAQDIANLYMFGVYEDKGITDLTGIEKLTSTEFLSIENNSVQIIPNGIKDLPLLFLSFKGCALNTIPSALGEITTLESLDMSNNNISSIPSSFQGNTLLHNFYLENNGLTAIPTSLNHLTGLKFLSLAGNDITEIPANFTNEKYPVLDYLNLVGNKIKEIPSFTDPIDFHIDVSDNQLEEIVPEELDVRTWNQQVNYKKTTYYKDDEAEAVEFDEDELLEVMPPIIGQYKEIFGDFYNCSWEVKQPDGTVVQIPREEIDAMDQIAEALSAGYGNYSLTLNTPEMIPHRALYDFLVESSYTVPIEVRGFGAGVETTLDGTVKDKKTNKPIEASKIEIIDADGVSEVELTDEDGYYLFEDLDGGLYTINVSADGYKSQTDTVNVPEDQLTTKNFFLEKDGTDKPGGEKPGGKTPEGKDKTPGDKGQNTKAKSAKTGTESEMALAIIAGALALGAMIVIGRKSFVKFK